MTTTLSEIQKHCIAIGLNSVKVVDEALELQLCCFRFVNCEGKKAISIRIEVIEDGNLVVIGAHGVMKGLDDLDSQAELCLRLCHLTMAIQAEFDENHRISIVVEHPVVDSTFSASQLKVYLGSIVEFVDQFGSSLDSVQLQNGVPVVTLDEQKGEVNVCEFPRPRPFPYFWRGVRKSSLASDSRIKELDSTEKTNKFSIETVGSKFDELQIPFEYSSGTDMNRLIFTRRPTVVYQGLDEQNQLQLTVSVDENCVKVLAPLSYQTLTLSDRKKLARLMLELCQKTKVFQAEMDALGNIVVVAEVRVLDTQFTSRQLKRLIDSLVVVLDEFDPRIRELLSASCIL